MNRTFALFLLMAGSVSAAESAVRVTTDVAFLAPGREEKLDLYLPAAPAAGKLSPAVVWIHGGGWTGGTKNENRAKEICGVLAGAGYVCVSINYRLGDGAWPTNLLDCKNAVRFLRAHAKEYQLDPARIAVAGGSAGGHLALMVGFTAGVKELEPDAPYPGLSSAVRAVIDLYGPADLLAGSKEGQPAMTKLMTSAQKSFGATALDAAVYRAASATERAAKNSPPVLILHGRADPTVDFAQSEGLARVLKERGVEHELIALDGVGHTFDFEQWNGKPLPRDLRPVALAFLEKHLAPGGR